MKNYLTLIIGLLIVFITSCSTPKELEYKSFKNFKINKASMDMTKIQFALEYYNPNNFALDLKDGVVDVFIDNNFLGKAFLNTTNKVPAKNNFLLPLSMDINLKNALKDFMKILFVKEITLKLAGFTKAGKGGVYFKVPIKYEGKQSVEFSRFIN